MAKLISKFFKGIFDIIEFLIIGVTVIALIFIFVGQPVRVTGDSMLPNFEDGEQLIAEKVSIKYSTLQRGEVVILRHPKSNDTLLIKRVVGMPGETFKISSGKVLIDGKELEEPYLSDNTSTPGYGEITNGEELTIPENSYVVLGDNRENSSDSREWGPIIKGLIIGRGFLVYYPLDSARLFID